MWKSINLRSVFSNIHEIRELNVAKNLLLLFSCDLCSGWTQVRHWGSNSVLSGHAIQLGTPFGGQTTKNPGCPIHWFNTSFLPVQNLGPGQGAGNGLVLPVAGGGVGLLPLSIPE